MELKTPYGERILFQILTEDKYVKPLNTENMNNNDYSDDELLNMFEKQGIDVKGKEETYLKIAKRSSFKINSNPYEITEKREKFLSDYYWVTIYNVAFYLCDYNDYYRYLDTHDGELIDVSFDYAKEHMRLAHEKEDFAYLDFCYSAHHDLCIFANDLDKYSEWIFKRFILRLNPIYDYENFYENNLVFDLEIIALIKSSIKQLHITDLKSYFKKIWDSEKIENQQMTFEECYRWLKQAVKVEDMRPISIKYRQKYLI